MAEMGFRTVDDMVGRVDRLDMRGRSTTGRRRGIDLSELLHEVDLPEGRCAPSDRNARIMALTGA
jgi:glutamate synthase (NADPH/NADH) large chain